MHPEPDHKFTISAKGLTLQLSGRIMALSEEETQTVGSGFFEKKESEDCKMCKSVWGSVSHLDGTSALWLKGKP